MNFDISVLPKWAQDDELVIDYCKSSKRFLDHVLVAGDKSWIAQNNLKRWAKDRHKKLQKKQAKGKL